MTVENRSAIDRRSMFWNLLLLASFIAASVSLLTTGLGLSRYLSPLLAWPLAFAVQAGLFGLAWLIAVGRSRLRVLVVVLYMLTMPFSVVFSYVMLQSEFTKEIRFAQTQRSLFDDLRRRSTTISEELEHSISESEELGIRLAAWLEMERAEGWTTSTCSSDDHCYLAGVCDRIQTKVENWERSYGRPYRDGPGEALIFGLLETEGVALGQVRANLLRAREEWRASSAVFADEIGNRERLRRFDSALAGVPHRDIQAVRCEAVTLPQAPPYEVFARDDALAEERPVYAFEDLVRVFSGGQEVSRTDYPTLFALFLAVFIDLFVLLVAIGAAVLLSEEGHVVGYPVVDPVPPEWSEALRRDIGAWIDGALLQALQSAEERKTFLVGVIDALRFDKGSRALLVPKDAQESRFGFLMVSSKAATPAQMTSVDGHTVTFVLEDWVYPALTRYLGAEASS